MFFIDCLASAYLADMFDVTRPCMPDLPLTVNDFPSSWFKEVPTETSNSTKNTKKSDNSYSSENGEKSYSFDDIVDFIAKNARNKSKKVSIKRILFNPPATVVFWSDGTKTAVVDETFDSNFSHVVDDDGYLIYTDKKTKKLSKIEYTLWKEQGLTHAIVKKLVPDYFSILEKWC